MPDVFRRRPLLLILLAGLALRTAIALLLPPGYDEAYYLFYGRHLDLSYFDHPAAVGIWAWLGQLLPWGITGLRLPALISYTMATALLALAARRQLSPGSDLWTAALAAISPLLLVVGGVLLLPDPPLLLALSAVIWALALNLPWGLLGLLLGALTLCKYQALPLLLCLLIWALSSEQSRRRLLGSEGLQALLGWLLVSSPLWIWNGQHHWVSFLFQGGRAVQRAGFELSGPLLFLLSQILALFPTIGVLLLLAAFARKPSGPKPLGSNQQTPNDFRRLLRWLALPQLLLFLLLAGRMQVLISWLVPTWWLLLPLAAEQLALAQRRRERWLHWWIPFTLIFPPLLALLAASHVRFGIASALLPATADTSRELISPGELRRALRSDPALLQELTQAKLLVGEQYYEPGFLALALGPASQASYTTFANDSRGFAFWQPRDGFKGQGGVLIQLVSPEEVAKAPAGQISSKWNEVLKLQPLGEVVLYRGGKPARVAVFHRFVEIPGSWPRRYGPFRNFSKTGDGQSSP
jgi:hypothetical protein